MFCSASGGYPCLKGKAHAIKHLGFMLRDLFYEWHDPTDGFQKGVLCAFASSCRSEEILTLYRSDFKLPRPIAEEVRNLCWAHVRQTKELMNYSDRRIFNVTFKHHWLLHAGHRARFQNPRMGWCFQGEDLMLHPCPLGTNGEIVHKKLLSRMIRSLEMPYSWSRDLNRGWDTVCLVFVFGKCVSPRGVRDQDPA